MHVIKVSESLAAVNGGAVAGGSDAAGNSKRLSETQGRRTPAKKIPPASLAEAMIMDTEAAVMANFDFLTQEGVGVDDEDDMSDDMDDNTDDDNEDSTTKRGKIKSKVTPLYTLYEYNNIVWRIKYEALFKDIYFIRIYMNHCYSYY